MLCYQIRQSFYPGKITPKEANHIGYELAMRWTKGRHASIVTTHTDRQHIHCHIYYNSTTLDCTRKFRNFWVYWYTNFVTCRSNNMIKLILFMEDMMMSVRYSEDFKKEVVKAYMTGDRSHAEIPA